MKLYYIKIDKDWDDLCNGDSVIFDLPTIRLKYFIFKADDYWLHIDYDSNNRIFKELGIADRYNFVNSIVNYRTTSGFPNVRSLDDLKKVIKALDDECVKKFGIPDSKSDYKEDKYLHPSELKDGDFIKIRSDFNEYIYIFKEYKDNDIYRYASINLESNQLNTESYRYWHYSDINSKITYATEEEKKILLNALAKKGYCWDFGAKKLREVYYSSANFTDETSIGIVEIPQEGLIRDCITNIAPVYSHLKNYNIFCDGTTEKPKEELNLFPTKKHYQLNFNY